MGSSLTCYLLLFHARVANAFGRMDLEHIEQICQQDDQILLHGSVDLKFGR